MKHFYNLKILILSITYLFKNFFSFSSGIKNKEAPIIASWNKGHLPGKSINEVFPGIETININIVRTFDRLNKQALKYKETVIINAIVKVISPASIIEIGTYEGNTTLNMAANSPENCSITTIDLPEDWNGKFAIPIPEYFKKFWEPGLVLSQIKKNNEYIDKISILKGDSAEINWNKFNNTDIIFIDGCKHYQYLWHDTEQAINSIKGNGGIIIWGNYADNKNVSKVVEAQPKFIKKYAIKDTRLAIGIVERYV